MRLGQQRQRALRLGRAHDQVVAARLGHLVRRHLAYHPARVDHAVARGDAPQLVEHVRAHHHGDAALLVQTDDEVAHLAHALGVQPVHRLVQQQHVGRAEHRQRQSEALLHAHRVVLRSLPARSVQPHDAQQLLDFLHIVHDAQRDNRPAHVIERGHVGVQPRAFHQRADADGLAVLRQITRQVGGQTAKQPHLPRRRANHAAHHLHRRGFAGAVSPDEPVDVALRDMHVQPVDDVASPIGFAQAPRLNRQHAILLPVVNLLPSTIRRRGLGTFPKTLRKL